MYLIFTPVDAKLESPEDFANLSDSIRPKSYLASHRRKHLPVNTMQVSVLCSLMTVVSRPNQADVLSGNVTNISNTTLFLSMRAIYNVDKCGVYRLRQKYLPQLSSAYVF